MIIEKEMLMIIYEIKLWQHYLEEVKIITEILTDHKNLEYFSKARINNLKQT